MEGLTPICNYCGKFSEKVKGDAIYPHRKDLYKLTFYKCFCCDAYVGCHKGTDKPLGRLANASLRKMKSKAHLVFDFIWKEKLMTRKEAYKFLAEKMRVDPKNCHIGMFDEQQCRQVIGISKAKTVELCKKNSRRVGQ